MKSTPYVSVCEVFVCLMTTKKLNVEGEGKDLWAQANNNHSTSENLSAKHSNL